MGGLKAISSDVGFRNDGKRVFFCCCLFVLFVCLFVCLLLFFWGVEMDVCIDFVGLHASVLILVVCLHPRPLCFGQSVRLSVCLSTCPAVYGCMSHAFRDICLPFFFTARLATVPATVACPLPVSASRLSVVLSSILSLFGSLMSQRSDLLIMPVLI